jgi:P27 family predicted phage terminase small subunit
VAKRGRKPKPPHLKLIEGNPGKRPIPELPQAPSGAPNEPTWSDVFGRGKPLEPLRKAAAREWKRVVPILDNLGYLSPIDVRILTDYCVCVARLEQCEREITTRGLLVETPSGFARNPAITPANQYRQQLRFYLSELGLGPSSRGRLPIPITPGDDAADADASIFD